MTLHPLSALGFQAISLAALGFEPATVTIRPAAIGGLAAGRAIVQPTDNPTINQALATQAMPAYLARLEHLLQTIPGARLAAFRNAKNPPRLAEKILGQGQPAETVSDYGAAQIAVDSPQAKDAVVAALARHFPILRQKDHFALGDPQYHYRCVSLQLAMPNQASEELQIVPREIWQANQQEHHDYKQARTAHLEGRDATDQSERARAINDAAMERFNSRNGVGRSIVKGAVVKGSRVRLAGGAMAKVVYVDPNMRIVRVRTEDGKNLTVRRKDLR